MFDNKKTNECYKNEQTYECYNICLCPTTLYKQVYSAVKLRNPRTADSIELARSSTRLRRAEIFVHACEH